VDPERLEPTMKNGAMLDSAYDDTSRALRSTCMRSRRRCSRSFN
jgi:hypothetical protein